MTDTGKLEERVRKLEQLLFGLKVAGGVLGVTTLGLLSYVAYATSGADEIAVARSNAIQAIQEEASGQAERFARSLQVRRFPTLAGNTIQNQNLGSYPVCFLITTATLNHEQACRCAVTESGGSWSLEMRLDPGVSGSCECEAACLELAD